ncbi:NAD(P)-dependent alcohol dehydrogenase [Paenibacillus sp. JCM 10914]|uniref:NAD(P)-dependent alcohol dehydrogenase n=1 Tax=Paenibacillus sp. JCM 10914 TaxID=1236974 RepID=UPI0003CC65C0|nr:NAD(P)-dependent alcohol dehydrogenase [Paenibacillus sp. JCM 10914]GAE08419.1 aryl-alcohol dehydrogenase [Paenibacillus sp. JCM 10914]
MKVKAAVINEVDSPYVLEELTLSDIREDEILVKMVASGICHSDAVARAGGYPWYPVVLGHEGSGIVEKVGSAVRGFEPGDHVVLSYLYCGHCSNCLTGLPASCEEWMNFNLSGAREDGSLYFQREDGSPVYNFVSQSSFSTHTIVYERNLTKVDKSVDLRLVGPLGCGFLTGSGTVLNGLKPSPGSTIAIFGTGAVGLAAMMAAKISGCSQIIGVDIHDNRLEVAKQLGATHTINSKDVDVLSEIKRLTNDKGVNYSIDTTGVPSVARTSIEILAVGGVAAPIASSKHGVEVNFNADLNMLNRTIKGVLMGNAVPQLSIPQLIQFYKDGQFSFDQLVKFYKFDEINEASHDSSTGKTIKPILIIDEDYVPGT